VVIPPAKGDNPTPFWCLVGYTRTRTWTVTSTTYTYTPIASAQASGTATNANPDVTLTLTQEKSSKLTASNTIGIDAEVVAQVNFSHEVGWSTTVSVSYPLDWANGVAYTAGIDLVDTTKSGTVVATDTSGASCFAACNAITHTHNGTFTATCYTGTRCTHTP